MTDVICHSDYQSSLALLLLTGSPALSPGHNYKELHHTATIICPDMCTSPPLRPSSRYLSQCLSHSKNISDISTQSRADIKMKPSVLPPSPYRQILADWDKSGSASTALHVSGTDQSSGEGTIRWVNCLYFSTVFLYTIIYSCIQYTCSVIVM